MTVYETMARAQQGFEEIGFAIEGAMQLAVALFAETHESLIRELARDAYKGETEADAATRVTLRMWSCLQPLAQEVYYVRALALMAAVQRFYQAQFPR